MGVKIYPRRVIDRANVTDRELDRLAGHVRGIRTSLGMLGNVGRLSLKGQAWDSARSYVAEVELPYINTKLQWIEAMKNGNVGLPVAGAVVIGTAAAVGVKDLYNNFKPFKDLVDGVGDAINDAGKNVFDKVNDIGKSFANPLKSLQGALGW